MKIDLNSLLALTPQAATPKAPAAEVNGQSFGSYLAQAIDRVAEAQRAADQAALGLVTGQATDLAQVTIASEKATLALQLLVQVRNKGIEAYQEIMRMPI